MRSDAIASREGAPERAAMRKGALAICLATCSDFLWRTCGLRVDEVGTGS